MEKTKVTDVKRKLKTMISVDFRKMFTSPLFYIMVGVAFVIPILILVMTTMMDGSTSVNPQTGEVTVMKGFENVWQAIGSVSGDGLQMSMDLVSMCNINLLYFLVAIFVCLFVADDFRSGYAKNLFTTRPQKFDYVISKTLAGFVCGAVMIVAFFVGAMLGGVFSKLSFALGGVSAFEIVMCLLSKIFLMLIFVSICLTMSVFAKQKSWLSILCSFGASMLLFTMIPMITPLNSGIINLVLCVAGGAMFSVGLGFVSNIILKKTSLV